jgi:hypothetical protein
MLFNFFAEFCFIQQLLGWKMIGLGREKCGLYHLILHNLENFCDSNVPVLVFPSAQIRPPFNAEVLTSTQMKPHFNYAVSDSLVVNYVNFVVEVSANFWHFRLRHLFDFRIQLFNNVPPGCSTISSKNSYVCPLAKQHIISFPISTTHSAHIFDLIHYDIWDPFSSPSSNGSKFFLTIVNDHNRFTWIYLMHNKSQTRFLNGYFFLLVETQFNSKIKCLRFDNGSEFHMTDFFSSMGIVHQLTCVETPQQNAIVERKHQHLLNVARALRFQAHLPLHFSGGCILTAAYLINRTPTPILKNRSLYECLFSYPSQYSHLRVFLAVYVMDLP